MGGLIPPARSFADQIRESEQSYTVPCTCPNCGWSGRRTFPKGMRVGGPCTTCGVSPIVRVR